MENIVILICGGTSSGKSTVTHFLQEHFWDKSIVVSQDTYYREYPKGTDFNKLNFDAPESVDFDEMIKAIERLKDNKQAIGYKYNFEKFKRVGKTKITPKKIIFVEGIFVFFKKEISNLANLKIFIEASEETRLTRRITRDIIQYNRKIKDVETRWKRDIQPSFEKYIKPYKKNADLIVKWEKLNNKEIAKVEKAIDTLLKG